MIMIKDEGELQFSSPRASNSSQKEEFKGIYEEEKKSHEPHFDSTFSSAKESPRETGQAQVSKPKHLLESRPAKDGKFLSKI